VTAGRTFAIGVAAVAGVVLLFVMFMWLPRWTTRATTTTTVGAAAPAPVAAPASGRKIKARLFYVADDGTKLTSVERDVAYGEGPVEQAREIISAQIAPVVEPLVSAVPPGTTLRAVFITEGGEAYVDLSRDVVSAHPGGTLGELLTVYTLVNALTENLPVVTAVQVLVDGKEVETLSGHIDLRRPLAKNLTWVQ
jgi:spore germination protein GerM